VEGQNACQVAWQVAAAGTGSIAAGCPRANAGRSGARMGACRPLEGAKEVGRRPGFKRSGQVQPVPGAELFAKQNNGVW